MAKINSLKRVIKEDFEEKDRGFVERFATIYNPLIDQLITVFDKQVTFDNLNQDKKSLEITVTADGSPINSTAFKTGLKTKTIGLTCIRVEVLTGGGANPTGTPLVSFSEDSGLITITNITNLAANTRYRLTLLQIGN